jgi:NDP-sugar pyrophosphorylase family protein
MLNLIVPMAGRGSRFSTAGYKEPKPLISFLGKKMIEHVVDAFPIEANKIFLVLKEHDEQFQICHFLKSRWPECNIVQLDTLTEGAACTVLAARNLIDNDTPLAILNSDNIIKFEKSVIDELQFLDGIIMTFEDTAPHWSYARTENGLVQEVAEKRQISTHATAGLYFWKNGKSFCSAADVMINKNKRVNGEFYVAPVYNENIEVGQKIAIRSVNEMHGVGTPEELQKYILKCE